MTRVYRKLPLTDSTFTFAFALPTMLKILLFSSFFCLNNAAEQPIIGILTQEVINELPSTYDSYIAASYVKYVEAAGGRVIPVWVGQSQEYYERVVKYTNGVLFPGGSANFTRPGGYGEAARSIFLLAIEANKKGIHYPIWGTCLGLQVLPYAQLGVYNINLDCPLNHVAVPLILENGYETSKLFSQNSEEIIEILKNKNVTYNAHSLCVTRNDLKENSIADDWQVLSTNQATNNIEFISTMEHKKYPFYGVQYHPEKILFEFVPDKGIPHTQEAVKVTQYFANFFLDECRKNNNAFPEDEIEANSLIYNYCPVYTDGYFEQTYGFVNEDYKKSQLEKNAGSSVYKWGLSPFVSYFVVYISSKLHLNSV